MTMEMLVKKLIKRIERFGEQQENMYPIINSHWDKFKKELLEETITSVKEELKDYIYKDIQNDIIEGQYGLVIGKLKRMENVENLIKDNEIEKYIENLEHIIDDVTVKKILDNFFDDIDINLINDEYDAAIEKLKNFY